MRSRDLKDPAMVLDQMRAALGNSPDFDLVYEGTHFHLEYQPTYRGA